MNIFYSHCHFARLIFVICFVAKPHHICSKFSKDFCKLTCNNRTHTLCVQGANYNYTCSYKSHKIYDSRELKILGLRDHLTVAHNGLRARIARRMHVANMVLINWSRQLSGMAENWAKMCRPYEDDECTHLSTPMTLNTLLNIMDEDQLEPFVAMNRFCAKFSYLSKELIPMAIHLWYFEKDHMHAPNSEAFENLILGFLSGENNFTHLAYPLIRQMGCSVAENDHTFCVFCFYAPYYRHTNGIVFEYGDPASQCPPQYPLKDLLYPTLCTRNLYLDLDEENHAADKIELFVVVFIWVLLQFIC